MNRSEASFDWKMETLPQPLPTQGRAMLPEGKSSIKVVPVTTPNEIFARVLPREFERNKIERPE